MILPALALAACSSGGDESSTVGDAAVTTSVADADETPSGDASAGYASAGDAPTGEGGAAADEPAIDESTQGGGPDSDWCAAARRVESASDALDAEDFDFTDPASVEDALGDMLSEFESALTSAPSEIRDDLDTSYANFRAFDDALAAVDYDFLRADLSVLADDEGEIEAATDRIEAYNWEVCGIPIDTDTDDSSGGDTSGDFDPTAGPIRDQTIAQLMTSGFTEVEAGCIFDNADLSDPDYGSDPAVIVAVFETCGIDAQRLLELDATAG